MNVVFLEKQPYFQNISPQGKNLEEEEGIFESIATIPLSKTNDFFYPITTSIIGSTFENDFLIKKEITSQEEISDSKPILPNIPKSLTGVAILPIVLTQHVKSSLSIQGRKVTPRARKSSFL